MFLSPQGVEDDDAPWGMQVEQESSLIGTRTLTVLVVVVGVAGYFLIRTWLLDPRLKTRV